MRTINEFVDDMMSDGKSVEQVRAVASQTRWAGEKDQVVTAAKERRKAIRKMCGQDFKR